MLVFDATPLVYLAKADRIEELDALEEEKIIPEKVYTEVVEEGKKTGEPGAEKIEEAVEQGVFRVTDAESYAEKQENSSLSQADIEVLSLAEEKDATAVMDEEHGRNVARARDVNIRGTAYLVLKLLKQGQVTPEQARSTIDTIIEEGWYCSTDLYKEIMNKINQL